MDREEIAIGYFKNGYNCSQSVLTSFKDILNIEEDELLKISSGFGAGMGRLQKTCGAVTGANMVIGLKYGRGINENRDANEKTYSLVKQLVAEFKKLNFTTKCADLVRCDLNTDEGQKYFVKNELMEKVCAKCIKDSVNILNKIIE